MTEILAALPAIGGLGVGGMLGLVLIYLMRVNHSDRSQYSTALAAEETRSQAKIDRLEKRLDALQAQLDDERRDRRIAQDVAARAEARAAAAEAQLASLRSLVEGRPLRDPAPQPPHPLPDSTDGAPGRRPRLPGSPGATGSAGPTQEP